MINRIEFLNDHWILPVIIASICLLILFIVKEWGQSGRNRLLLKMVLSLIAISCLALIALKPAFPIESNGKQYVLLTKQFSANQLDSIKGLNPKIEIFEYNPDETIPAELRSADKVFLLGNGVQDFDLWQLDNTSVEFLGDLRQKGITRIKYAEEYSIGDRLTLLGDYSLASEEIKIVLQDPGGAALDSVSLNIAEEQQFELAAQLKVAGKYIYSLILKDSLGKILKKEPIPVKVVEKEKLNILVVNNFPTFETKYLKNFLAEEGHVVVLKSQLTRGRYKYEYFNTSSFPIGNLTEPTLEKFDLVVMDAVSLRNLSREELLALYTAIRQKGLGLFVQADESYFMQKGESNTFHFSALQGSTVIIPELGGEEVTRASYQIQTAFALEPIHREGKNIFSAYKRLGKGRVGSTVFTDTWNLILDGKSEIYRKIWSDLIEKTSRRKSQLIEWKGETMTAYVNEPFDFKIKTAVAEPILRSGKGNVVPMVQDVNIPNQWMGKTWPRVKGWNNISLDTIGTWNYYVMNRSNWQTISATKTIENNRRYFQRKSTKVQVQQILHPIEPFWFFIFFLICIGGLWLEPKL